MAGPSPDYLKSQFHARFPSSAAPALFRAPGRVNLIGEHTDYNLGFVMPIAIDLACYAAVATGATADLRVYSENLDQEHRTSAADLATAKPRGDWSDYVIGVAQLLKAGPVDLLIHSTVPVGSGLSSSAALEVASALAFLSRDREGALDKLQLARLCQAAERNFVGMPCGIMDQFISIHGKAHRAIKLDCRSLEYEEVPLPESVAIIAVNSMVKHELGASAYRQRVAECAEAVASIQHKHPQVASLRDATAGMLDEVSGDPLKRARHIIGENERVNRFAEAARRSDLAEMGALFVASHRSLQHDYEVSCDELDFLVDTAIGLPGVYGARMTGGGFGGCTVNLVDPARLPAFEAAITSAYQRKFNVNPRILPCTPSDGAGPIKV